MAIEDIGKNALQVLEKRYLAKDAEGNHTDCLLYTSPSPRDCS